MKLAIASDHAGLQFEARMARAHNDANVLCLGSHVVCTGLAKEIVDAFLDEPFEGGRHERRLQKIRESERRSTSGEG